MAERGIGQPDPERSGLVEERPPLFERRAQGVAALLDSVTDPLHLPGGLQQTREDVTHARGQLFARDGLPAKRATFQRRRR